MKKTLILTFVMLLSAVLSMVKAQTIVLSVSVDNSGQCVINATVSDSTLNGYETIGLFSPVTVKDNKFAIKCDISNIRGPHDVSPGVDWCCFEKKNAQTRWLKLFFENGTITAQPIKEGSRTYIARGTPWNDEFALFHEGKETYIDVFKRHTDDLIGKYILRELISDYKYSYRSDELDELWPLVGEHLKKDRKVKHYIALRSTAVGQSFIDFTATKIDTTVKVKVRRKSHNRIVDKTNYPTVRLSDYVGKGQWVLVDFRSLFDLGYYDNFWYRGRKVKKDNPQLESIRLAYNQFKDQGVLVISAILREAYWVSFYHPEASYRYKECVGGKKALNIKWDVLMCDDNPTRDYALYYTRNSIMHSSIENLEPETILFAPDGTIAVRNLFGDAMLKTIAEKIGK